MMKSIARFVARPVVRYYKDTQLAGIISTSLAILSVLGIGELTSQRIDIIHRILSSQILQDLFLVLTSTDLSRDRTAKLPKKENLDNYR